MAEEDDEQHETSTSSTPKATINKSNEKGMDTRSTINDVMYCVRPAFYLENVFGIFRFNVTEAGFAPVSTHQKFFGIITAMTIIIAFGNLMEMPSIISGFVTNPYDREAFVYGIVDIVDEVPSVVVIIQYLTAVLSTLFILGNQTIQIFKTFVELDMNLRLNINANFYNGRRSSRSRTIKFLLFLIAVHIILSILDLLTDKTFEFRKIIAMVLYLEQDMEIFVFCKMINMLKARLQILNEYLEKFVQEKDQNKTPIFIVNDQEPVPDKQFNFIGRISPINMKIRDLASMYDTIGNTCNLINEVFQFQIFMNLAFTFTFIIITIWTSLYYVRTPESGAVALMTAANWCILTIVSVAVMSFSCENLLTARNSTKLLVNEIIMDYDLPKTMRVQAKVFMELIEAWPLRVFVYDMFSVDIKLMLKFVSVATTYLIVVIQISHFV